jgi:hypothetical protein
MWCIFIWIMRWRFEGWKHFHFSDWHLNPLHVPFVWAWNSDTLLAISIRQSISSWSITCCLVTQQLSDFEHSVVPTRLLAVHVIAQAGRLWFPTKEHSIKSLEASCQIFWWRNLHWSKSVSECLSISSTNDNSRSPPYSYTGSDLKGSSRGCRPGASTKQK